MPSDLYRIDFQQEWYDPSGNLSFQSSVTTDDTEPFVYQIILDPVQPYTDKVNAFITPFATSVTENYIFYGGNYKPLWSSIQISGTGLTAAQRSLIRSSISPNISQISGGQDKYVFNITPLAQAGIQFFTLTIPYEETEIQNTSSAISIPFLDISGDGISNDPTIVSVDAANHKIIIDGGNVVSNSTPSVRITNIANGRTLISASAEKSDGLFNISVEEDISDRPLVIVDKGLSQISAHLAGGFFYDINYHFAGNTTDVGSGHLVLDISKGLARYGQSSSPSTFVYENDMFTIRTFQGCVTSWTFTSRTTMSVSFQWPVFLPASARRGGVWQFSNSHLYQQDVVIIAQPTSVGISTMTLVGGQMQQVQITRTVNNNMQVRDVHQQLNSAINELAQTYGVIVGVQFVSQVLESGSAAWRFADFTNLIIPFTNGAFFATPITYTVPQVSENVSNLDISLSSGRTIQSVIDHINTLFFPYPIFVTTNFTHGSNSGWEAYPSAAISDQSFSLTGYTLVSGNYFGTERSHVVDAGGIYDQGSADFDLSQYATFTQLASAINANQVMSRLNILASAGAGFENLSPTAYLASNHNYDSINSIADVPSYLVVAPTISSTSSFDLNVILDGTITVAELTVNINSNMPGLFIAEIISGATANIDANSLGNQGPDDIAAFGSLAIYNLVTLQRLLREYLFQNFPTLSGTVLQINSDWAAFGVTAAIDPATNGFPAEAITNNLSDLLPGVNVHNDTAVLYGLIHEVPTPPAPQKNVAFGFDIRFATGGNPDSEAGIEVALGGYESKGVFYPNTAPNTFFEPGFNTLFPVEFTVLDADRVYLLVRTRQNLEGTTFTSETADYSAVARYTNGLPPQTVIPHIPTETTFTDVWTETNLGDPPVSQVPVALTVPALSPVIDIFADDVQISDSVHVTIFNAPSAINDFGFLAINRSNLNGSMQDSRNGRVFGTVLDNRGIWDILIAPEAELHKIADGSFSYLGSQYRRDILDADEAYDFSFNDPSAIPGAVKTGLSIVPVPGYPQVWALKIERSVKEYLASIRSGASRNSQDGCSIDVDLLVTGRESGVQGLCRVTIFYDVYCVFDVKLCDAYWNLVDPSEPAGPHLIENRLSFVYESLIDCGKLNLSSGGVNTSISVPVLLTAQNVPTFKNGNALLLIKSFYTAEIQGFYFPMNADFDTIQFQNCSSVSDNEPLARRLNKSILYLENQAEPIVDPIEIQTQLDTASSYLYIKPAFQFPSSDHKKDCGVEEIVAIGIGYQFKNWRTGFRNDDVLLGVDLVIPGGQFVVPELDLCYRYYYDQKET